MTYGFKHEGDRFSDLMDDAINSHAMSVGMDPDHEYWDEWYDAEWLVAFTAYMSELLPNLNVTVRGNAPSEGAFYGFVPWKIETEATA